MALLKNLEGRRFGRLVVIGHVGQRGHFSLWECRCDCGMTRKIVRSHLVDGHTNSCGCLRREVALAKIKYTHTGRTKDRKKWLLWQMAKQRARRQNVPFDIDLEDIHIPEVCPLLEIPLVFNKKKIGQNSPTLDKIIPAKGYVKGNIQVISCRANWMKGSASLAELEKMVQNFRKLLDTMEIS